MNASKHDAAARHLRIRTHVAYPICGTTGRISERYPRHERAVGPAPEPGVLAEPRRLDFGVVVGRSSVLCGA